MTLIETLDTPIGALTVWQVAATLCFYHLAMAATKTLWCAWKSSQEGRK